MIKHLKKVGNGNAVFLDKAIMELVGLEENADVQLSVHNGSIILTPANPKPVDKDQFEACLNRIVKERRPALRRLAE